MAMIDFDMYEGLEDYTHDPAIEDEEEDFFSRRKRRSSRGRRRSARRRGRSSRGRRRSRRRGIRSAKRTARRVRRDRRRVARGKKPKNPTLYTRYKGRSVRSIRSSYGKPRILIRPLGTRKSTPTKSTSSGRANVTTRKSIPVRRTFSTNRNHRRDITTPKKSAPVSHRTVPSFVTRKRSSSSSSRSNAIRSGGAVPTFKTTSMKLNKMRGIITSRNLKEHLVVNKAIQNEMKTKQEAQKARGLKKKVAQEDLKTEGIAQKVNQEKYKTEKLKAQTQMISTGKGLIWIGVCIGGYFFITKVLMKDFQPNPASKPTKG